MKTLYLECNMGAAGDMLTAALWELLDEARRAEFLHTMNGLGLPGVEVRAEKAAQCGIWGTHMQVTVHGEEEESLDVNCGQGHADGEHEHSHEHTHAQEHGHAHSHEHEQEHEHNHAHCGEALTGQDHAAEHPHIHEHTHEQEHIHDHPHGGEGHHHHHHTGMAEIEAQIGALALPEAVRQNALSVFRLLAQAESHAHDRPVEQIHFHEVGTMDAVADVVGACLLIHMLAPDEILASPVHVGCGQVRCAHGILPVPAPATAYLLQGVPAYGGSVQGELCTPTGAALLRHFVKRFGPMPVMAAQAIGYGMGKKEFAQANCVRAFWGETADRQDEVAQLSCNLDDMTGEDIAFAAEQLLAAGALDVWTQAIGMKKGRPGVMLCCLCRPEDTARLGEVMLRHTTTLGVRKTLCTRQVLERENRVLQAGEDTVRVKIAAGAGAHKAKLEYEDLAAIARRSGETLTQVRRRLASLLEE